VYHINMLKKYFEPGDSSKGVSEASKTIKESSDLENVAAAVSEDETDKDVELINVARVESRRVRNCKGRSHKQRSE